MLTTRLNYHRIQKDISCLIPSIRPTPYSVGERKKQLAKPAISLKIGCCEPWIVS